MLLGDAAKTLTRGNLFYVFTPWNGHYSRLFWQPATVIFYKIFGYNAAPFYTLMLLFHLLNILLTFQIAQKLTRSKFIAFFSSFLYGVYQINLETVAWISSGMKDLPMTTFFLLSFFSFITFFDKKKKLFLLLSYIFFALSLGSEFKALLIPLVFFTYEFIVLKYRLNFKKYLPFVFIAIILILFFYNQTPKLFSGTKNWKGFLLAFPASLSFYLLPISRIFWSKIFVNAHLSLNLPDELYLKIAGLFVFGFLIASVIFLKLKNEKNCCLILLFLLAGILINYLPVMSTVLSNYHSFWNVLTTHWRYFTLSSPLAAILITSSIVWVNEKLFFKIPILPFLLFSIFIFFHIEFNRVILFNYHLKWKIPAKNIFQQIKLESTLLKKETIFVVEGTDIETTFPYFQHRYLFENIFALYARPNNSDYLTEQKNLSLNPNEGSDRSLKRVLYYTNIKDFLVGNHRHIYAEGENNNFITPTLSWSLPAYDRLFLGAVYGDYNPENLVDFKFLENGSIVNVTEERKKEVKKFLSYFCFENGNKKCNSKNKLINTEKDIKSTMGSFSKTGGEIIEYLIKLPPGPFPNVEKIEVPLNI